MSALPVQRPWTRIFPIIMFTCVGLYQTSTVIADVDLWGYLAFGRLFWNSPSFPLRDVFSYVPTLYPWVYHEWLTGAIFYPIYISLGVEGLQTLKYLLASATFGLLYSVARNRGHNPIVCAVALCMVTRGVAFAYSPVRAQAFTCFFFSLTLYILDSARAKTNCASLWLITLIMLPWCNMHGGFLVGLGIVGLYCIDALVYRRHFFHYLAVLLSSASITLINPYGLRYWIFLIKAISMPRPEIWEWTSIDKALMLRYVSWPEAVNLAAIILLGVFLVGRTHRTNLIVVLTMAVTLLVGLLHIRHLVFYYLLMGAFLPGLFSYYTCALRADLKRVRISYVARRYGMLFLMLLISFWALLGFLRRSPLNLKIPSEPEPPGSVIQVYYPLGAIKYIQDRGLSGNLLTEFNWGEYLIWELYPRCRIALDGRYETVYPDHVAKEYFTFINKGGDCLRFVRDYPPDMILLSQRPVVSVLRSDRGWKEVYSDAGSILLLKEQ